jgi:predicted ester cyclase
MKRHSSQLQGVDMSTESNVALVKRFYVEVVNQKKVEVLDEILALDFAGFIQNGAEGGMSRTDAKQTWSFIINVAFSEWRQDVHEYIAVGDKVLARWTCTGVHSGSNYMGAVPCGKRVKVNGMEMWEVVNGKLTAMWLEGDFYGLLD